MDSSKGSKGMLVNPESWRKMQHYVMHAVVFNIVVLLLIFYFYNLIHGRHTAVLYFQVAIQVMLIMYIAAFICIIWSY